MKPRKGFEPKESRLIELIENGLDGKSALELRLILSRILGKLGRKEFLLLLEIPFLPAQEGVGFLLQFLGNVV